jgi:hypothetical protein
MSHDAKTVMNSTVRDLPAGPIDAVRKAHIAHQQETARAEQVRAGAQAKADQAYKISTAASASLYSTAMTAAQQTKGESSRQPKQLMRLAAVVLACAAVLLALFLALGKLETGLALVLVGTPTLLGVGLMSFAAISLLQARRTYSVEAQSALSQQDSLLSSAKTTYESAMTQAEEECQKAKAAAEQRRTEAVTKALAALDAIETANKHRSGQSPANDPSAKTALALTLAMPSAGDPNQSKK